MAGSGTPEASSRSMVDHALDLTVFAPLGFALDCRRIVPELAAVGRRQLAFSRSLGTAALKTIARSAASAAPASPTSPQATEPVAAGAVDSYDEMSARAIIAVARTADEPTRAWMLARERAGKKRVTVLRALDDAVGT